MNDDLPIDPVLRSLEAHVSKLRPKLPDCEARNLLYQCAFVAGQKSFAGRTRRWQMVSAAMVALVVAVSITAVFKREDSARPDPTTMELAASGQVQTAGSVPRPVARAVVVSLDAWQVRPDGAVSFETALAKFKRLDADSRSLAVGATLRAASELP